MIALDIPGKRNNNFTVADIRIIFMWHWSICCDVYLNQKYKPDL